jgi:hypothetical protein
VNSSVGIENRLTLFLGDLLEFKTGHRQAVADLFSREIRLNEIAEH